MTDIFTSNQCPHASVKRDTHGWRCDDCLRVFFPSGDTGSEQEAVRLRAILKDAAPAGIETWCDECGGKDEKCPTNCWVRRARKALSGDSSAPETTEQLGLRVALNRVKAALIYACFAQHKTPQYMLPEGITLINGDAVEVTVDGVKVYVGPERSAQETGPKPDAEKAPVTSDEMCPTWDRVQHKEHNGKCIYCGAQMPSQKASAPCVFHGCSRTDQHSHVHRPTETVGPDAEFD